MASETSLELVLDAAAHDLRDEGASGVALRELSQLGDATLGGEGAWSTIGLVVVLGTGSQTGLLTDDKNSAPSALDWQDAPPIATTEI